MKAPTIAWRTAVAGPFFHSLRGERLGDPRLLSPPSISSGILHHRHRSAARPCRAIAGPFFIPDAASNLMNRSRSRSWTPPCTAHASTAERTHSAATTAVSTRSPPPHSCSVPRQLRLTRTATHSSASRSPPGTNLPCTRMPKLRQRKPKIAGQTGKHPLAGLDRDTHRSDRPLPILIVADTKRFGRHPGRPAGRRCKCLGGLFLIAPSMGFHGEVSSR